VQVKNNIGTPSEMVKNGFYRTVVLLSRFIYLFCVQKRGKNPLLFCMHKHTVCCQVIFSVVVV